MKNLGCCSLPFFLALFLSGSEFLSSRSQEAAAAHLTSSDVSTLKRRYWNDDLQSCIKKYCYEYQKSPRNYRVCLRYYCPRALIAVPRDLEDLALGLSSRQASEDAHMASPLCAAIFCPMTSHADFTECFQRRCGSTAAAATAGAAASEPSPVEMVTTLGSALTRLCKQTLCQDQDDDSFESCLVSKCLSSDEPDSDDAHSEHAAARRDVDLYRKRRVNDDVSQCIQSYCGGKGFKNRLVCIVRNCHHPSG